MKNTKGITLIALIITIIIMLILVAVSINIAINTGLFKSAGDATRNWQVAQEEESHGGTLEIDGKKYSSIEEYMETRSIDITYNDALKQFKPGDYVIYDTEIEGVGEVACRVLYDATSPYGLQIVTDDCIKRDGEYVYIPFGPIRKLTSSQVTQKFGDYDFSEWYNYKGKEVEQYNNAIAILNNKAMEFCSKKYMVDARCIGSYPGNKERETKSFAVIPDEVNKYQTGITNAKDEDDNYISDYNQLQNNSILITNKHYWFASRYNEVGAVYVGVKGLIFNLRNNGDVEFCDGYDKILQTESGRAPGASVYDYVEPGELLINALRPVFTLRGDLKVVSGDGKSETTAYRLGV